MSNSENHHVFNINTICNYDPDIIPYLNSPIGTYLIRVEDGTFVVDDKKSEIFFEKQNIFK